MKRTQDEIRQTAGIFRDFERLYGQMKNNYMKNVISMDALQYSFKEASDKMIEKLEGMEDNNAIYNEFKKTKKHEKK